MSFEIEREKAEQVRGLLQEMPFDCWMTFVRESDIRPDPGVELVVGTNVTWISAFLFFRSHPPIAIVGNMDVPTIRASGIFEEVLGYDQDVKPQLITVLERLHPRQVALNYSISDVTADGLTLGMRQLLDRLVAGSLEGLEFVSAESLLGTLRARKTRSEIERIREAIEITESSVAECREKFRVGQSEVDIAGLFHDSFRARGMEPYLGHKGPSMVPPS